MKIACFVSGNGTNLQAIINSVRKGRIKGAQIALVVSDNKNAYALKRAKKANIETFVLDPKGFKKRKDYDREVVSKLKKKNIDLVILAGFMRLVSDYFIRQYKHRIMNIHPALLPSFKGTRGIKDAYEYGVKKTGVTVHFVDEKLDHGPIILQESVDIKENDTFESVEKKVHKAEHELYPEAIRLFVEGKIKIEGRKIKIKR